MFSFGVHVISVYGKLESEFVIIFQEQIFPLVMARGICIGKSRFYHKNPRAKLAPIFYTFQDLPLITFNVDFAKVNIGIGGGIFRKFQRGFGQFLCVYYLSEY